MEKDMKIVSKSPKEWQLLDLDTDFHIGELDRGIWLLDVRR